MKSNTMLTLFTMKCSRQYSFLFFIIYLFNSVIGTENIYERISGYVQDSDYVDPHSLYYNRHSQSVKTLTRNDYIKSEDSELTVPHVNVHPSCKDSSYEVFSRRLVNIIISKANFKIDGVIALGKLELEATIEELETLKSYGEGKLHIREIDGILNNVIRPVPISFYDEALNFTDKILIYLYEHRVIFGSIVVLLFVIIIAFKVQWTRFKIILLLFDIIATVSFMFTWWELLQEAEIKLISQRSIYNSMPSECQQEKIGFFRTVLLYVGIGKGDCLEYHKSIMTDPLLTVTPLHALSHMLSKFFFYPISQAGHYLSDFIDGMTGQIPYPFNLIARILLSLFMPCLLSLLLFIYLGGSMGVRIGPFYHLYFHSNKTETPTIKIENPSRQAIEIIRSDLTKIKSNASENSKPQISDNQNSSEPIKKPIMKSIEEIVQPKIEKQTYCDTSSDEFLEEKKCEKISKTHLEDKIEKETIAVIGNTSFKKANSQDEDKLSPSAMHVKIQNNSRS